MRGEFREFGRIDRGTGGVAARMSLAAEFMTNPSVRQLLTALQSPCFGHLE